MSRDGGAARSRSAGLVSVPTSPPLRKLPGPPCRAHAAAALAQAVGGFIPDQGITRTAKLRQAVGFAARAHGADRPGFRPDRVLMLTATYRDGVVWSSKHCRRWVESIRKWFVRQGVPFRYVWISEAQDGKRKAGGGPGRGAIHYHLALWMPASLFLPSSDLAGWWPHGATKTERARGAVGYLMSYFKKNQSRGTLPTGSRAYGVGGLEHSLRRARRWLGLPGFVQARADIYDDWRRAPGGGWADPDGVCIPSEFERTWLGVAFGLLRVADYGRPFHASGPFSWIHRGAHRG